MVVIQQHQVVIHREQKTNLFFDEILDSKINLRMMQIPAGQFLMGSPDDELERFGREGPQHQVSVAKFFLAKYPVTQEQWRIVAALPEIGRKLDLDPSGFKGDRRPVERISWYDAVEFCARLRQKSGREYRLSTEAEWEYACRAGTTTPFHFGETITTDLANYRGTDDKRNNWKGNVG